MLNIEAPNSKLRFVKYFENIIEEKNKYKEKYNS